MPFCPSPCGRPGTCFCVGNATVTSAFDTYCFLWDERDKLLLGHLEALLRKENTDLREPGLFICLLLKKPMPRTPPWGQMNRVE